MDLNAFFQNPIKFIDEIAQFSDVRPDFGINQAIVNAVNENPEILNSLPLITSLGHLQTIAPGSIARFRVTFLSNYGNDCIPLKLKCGDRFFTPLLGQDVPEGCEPFDLQSMISRQKIVVSSVSTQTKWLREYNSLGYDQVQSSGHLTIDPNQSTFDEDLFEEPFQAVARFLTNTSERPLVVMDLIGFIEEPVAVLPNTEINNSLEVYLSTLPNILVFASFPVNFLYSPIFPGPTPPLPQVREKIIQFLSIFFQPITAELILLWLIGRVRSRVGTLPIGIFSLNLFGANESIASCVVQILIYLCTSLNFIDIHCNAMNERTLQPAMKDGEFKPTSLSSINNTRIIIDETRLSEGTLQQTGVQNYVLLRHAVESQVVPFLYELYEKDVETSFPFLILSQARSFIKANVSVPIGEVRFTEFNADPNVIALMRTYVEQMRGGDFIVGDNEEAQQLMQQHLVELMRADSRVDQFDLHLLMTLNQLNSISFGQNQFSQQIWNHSVELFKYIISNKPINNQ
ncbi:Mini-chromosome maintenance complex-binding protein [Histomonas meleagridis]|uniref:Mini-chromosome maintenance complex-binding protein n=1 Tax=Histomonas meleagridis TaxID=135588 RepID=UPI003559F486|nr:Mini-chromosome maintenance complex-binding protein [Histomonas meleagridis]KAH0805495.1 Mini-chromosome maintenance complex-binding protein [Histomonas meleagridis]